MQLWLVAAFASALFAGVVSILAKCGIKTIDSDVATALRTCVVAVFTWVMVAIASLRQAKGFVEAAEAQPTVARTNAPLRVC